MAKSIDSKVVFMTTSPRTPEKMIPEIDLLEKNFSGKKWNVQTQVQFMQLLSNENFFHGSGENSPDFSARDRINRAPKSLGFITLAPAINLTPAGRKLISAKRTEEIFLRQLLKFQIPSPYHKSSKKAAKFFVKPYLEILRLVHKLGTLKFDELEIFGLQITDFRKFDEVVKKIEDFRKQRTTTAKKYKEFKQLYFYNELQEIYKEEIASGEFSTRESSTKTVKEFFNKKMSNMRDYADACVRYLRATGLVSISQLGKSLSIMPEKKADVEFILKTVKKEPIFIDNEQKYIEYLGNPEFPKLLTDDKNSLIEKLETALPHEKINKNLSVLELKEKLDNALIAKKNEIIRNLVAEIKDYKQYDDIQQIFDLIPKRNSDLSDVPLMFEWNTWRAMTMLDGGNIKANLKFDDFGNPMSTAQGNMADIVCNYDDFDLIVEVTIASGQKQYEMEGEPVSRHLGKLKKETGRETYGLFIAPTINEACIAQFYMLYHTNISYYGGKSAIVPLPLNIFRKMVEDSFKADYMPDSNQVKAFFEYSKEIAKSSSNEQDWYKKITEKALDWLA